MDFMLLPLVVLFSLLSSLLYNLKLTRFRAKLKRDDLGSHHHHGHFLDLSEDFIRNAYLKDGMKVMSLATYLHSVEFNNQKLTLKKLLINYIWNMKKKSVLFRSIVVSIVGLIPPVSVLGYHISSGEDLLGLFDGFLGAFSFQLSIVLSDLLHHFHRGSPHSLKHFKNNNKSKKELKVNAVEKMFIGNIPNPCLFPDMINELIEKDLRNEPHPDSVCYECPDPFLPEVFPNLCVGTGGLKTLQTPRKQARSNYMREIFNRLTANSLLKLPQSSALLASEKEFVIVYKGEKITSPEVFFQKVAGIRAFFNVNSTAFGQYLCVKDPSYDASKFKIDPATKTSVDPGCLQMYTQLPIAYPHRVGIEDEQTKSPLTVLSHHASFCVHSTAPNEEFMLQFYLGPDGVTSFKSDPEYYRPWCEFHKEPLEGDLGVRAVEVAAMLACVMNHSAVESEFDFGAYGEAGSCVDSIAIIKAVLFPSRELDAFPVLINGALRASVVRNCKGSFLPHFPLKQTVLEGFIKAAYTLPHDANVSLGGLNDTLRRIKLSTTYQKYEISAHTGKVVDEIKSKWEEKKTL